MSPEERIAVLESQMGEVKRSIENIDNKLDQLLEFRNKGAGVFWLISAVSGTGLIGLVTWLIDSVRGH